MLAFLAVVLTCLPHQNPSPGQATGQLTVTAIVNSSSTLVFEPDGTFRVIVANAPADMAELILAATQPKQASPQTPPKRHKTTPPRKTSKGTHRQ